jgi:NAD(P)-dependent dehydrogenase (short-subunit alcohol dehydrogenase family)
MKTAVITGAGSGVGWAICSGGVEVALGRRGWKLVSTYPDGWELYDLAADRVERNNLAARHPDIVKTLATEWNAWAERARVDPWPGPRRLPWGDDAPAADRRGK